MTMTTLPYPFHHSDNAALLFPMPPRQPPEVWRTDPVDDGERIIGLACDGAGREYEIPFAIYFDGDDWRNDVTGYALDPDVEIVGWRPCGACASATPARRAA